MIHSLPKRSRNVLWVALVVLPLLLVISARLRSPAHLSWPERQTLRLLSPIEHTVSGVVGGLGTIGRRYVWFHRTAVDNDWLRAENGALSAELAQVKYELAQKGEVERLLALKRKLPDRTVAARVIGVSTSPYFRVVRLQLDRGDGEVEAGMAVVSARGAVGLIERVAGSVCDVRLATDAKSAIDVIVPRSGARGVFKGATFGGGALARIAYLERKEEVHEGDEVVTSGVGPFPAGITIGRVTAVKKRDYGLYQDVDVEPAVDFSRLDAVLVVARAVVTPLPPLADKAGAK
jgi:rod shape-determining protein MreC